MQCANLITPERVMDDDLYCLGNRGCGREILVSRQNLIEHSTAENGMEYVRTCEVKSLRITGMMESSEEHELI